jgi:hypothetical protein
MIAAKPLTLYCGYSMDPFDPAANNPFLEGVLCTHSHLIPSESKGVLKSALWKGMEDVLGEKSHEIRNLEMGKRNASWVVLPELEATMLWLTKNVPHELRSIVGRAREHYQEIASPATNNAVVGQGV